MCMTCVVPSCGVKTKGILSLYCKKHTFYRKKLQDLGTEMGHYPINTFLDEHFLSSLKHPNGFKRYLIDIKNGINPNQERYDTIAGMVVSTGDIPYEYEIIGPVYFSTNNRAGIISESPLTKLMKKYKDKIDRLKKEKLTSGIDNFDWGFLYGELSFGMGNTFDIAYFLSVEELKKRVYRLGGDGIIFLRQDIDIDTTHFQRFYLQMHATAVKFIEPAPLTLKAAPVAQPLKELPIPPTPDEFKE